MANLKLKLACWDYDRTRPLIDGRVRLEGIDLDISVMRPREAFARMLDREEFDIAEVSLASYARLKAERDERFVGIPVALSRMFRHSCIYLRADAGITKPQDLRGRRVGAVQLDSTGLIFIKGMLAHDYAVTPEQVRWVIGGLEKPAYVKAPERGHGVVEMLEPGDSLCAAIERGDIDALISNHIPSLFLNGAQGIVRLFSNYKAVEQDYYRRTGIFPIMHTVVIRADLYRDDPRVAARIYDAFCQARDLAVGGIYDTDALRLALPWLIDHIEETRGVLGRDYWTYGAKANQAVWSAFCEYQVEQQLSPRKVGLDELFVAG
ncbi:MAG: ABC transporter substrate-binding protein [Acidobacteriota bacterium]